MEDEKNNNIDTIEIESKYKLAKNIFYSMIFLTICVVFIKLFFHKYNIFYYSLEILVFLSVFVVLLVAFFRKRINVFCKNSNTNLAIGKNIFKTMDMIAFWIYVIGPALIILLYPQIRLYPKKVLFIGLYIPICFIPCTYYLYMIMKNKNLISKKDVQIINTTNSSKWNFVIMGILYGIGMELFFSYWYRFDFNIIHAILIGTFFAILMYFCLSKFSK